MGNEERKLLAQIIMDNAGNRITVALANGIVATFANEILRIVEANNSQKDAVPIEQ